MVTTQPAPGVADRLRGAVNEAVDRLAGSDPGLNRLRVALLGVVSIAVALLAAYLFVVTTGALQVPVPAGPPTAVAAATAGNHDLLIIALLLALMVNFFATFGPSDRTVARQAGSLALLVAALVASLALGLSIGGVRVVALASFPVVLTLGGLARRWGPKGAMIGMPLFVGDFIGYFLHGLVAMGDIGWLAAEIGVGALAHLVVRATVFRVDDGAALRRSQRSWTARARAAARQASAQLIERGGGLEEERLRRRLTRLNESSLIIDAQLAEPGALPVGSSARRLHDELFEAELGLVNACRFAVALGRMALPEDAASDVASAMAAIADDRPGDAAAIGHAMLDRLAESAGDNLGDEDAGTELRTVRVLLHRFAASVVLYGRAQREWIELGSRTTDERDDVFVPSVVLTNGWLPGSADVSATASTRSGPRPSDRLRLAPYIRSSLQLGTAVALAIVIGDQVSGRRFYWAVIAAFVSFYGTNNTVEQIRKAFYRVAGTVVGILAGSLLATAIGHNAAGSVVIVLVCIFAGLYLFRINYAFMTIAVTIMVSLLYEQLSEFTFSLLLLRLAETAVGAGVAVVTVLVVLPLRTSRVLDVALGEVLGATRRLVGDAVRGLTGSGGAPGLVERARDLDSAFQSLVVTARPLRHLGSSGRRAQGISVAAGALRHYGRNLTLDVPAAGCLPGTVVSDLHEGSTVLLGSLDRLTAAVVDGVTGGTFVRSASRWNLMEQRAIDDLRRAVDQGEPIETDVAAVTLAARDLQLLDGALADLATLTGMEVTDLDTSRAGVAEAPVGPSAAAAD